MKEPTPNFGLVCKVSSIVVRQARLTDISLSGCRFTLYAFELIDPSSLKYGGAMRL